MIFHVHNDSGYAMISNTTLKDKLSVEALGMLCYLLSMPRDWQVVPAQLRAHFGLGEHRFQRIMRELMATGYARRRYRQDRHTKQWDGSEYDIYGQPQRRKPRRISRLESREGDYPVLGKSPPQDTQTNSLHRVADKKERLGSKEDRTLSVEEERGVDLDCFDDPYFGRLQ
jgi:hypothetical protein